MAEHCGVFLSLRSFSQEDAMMFLCKEWLFFCLSVTPLTGWKVGANEQADGRMCRVDWPFGPIQQEWGCEQKTRTPTRKRAEHRHSGPD